MKLCVILRDSEELNLINQLTQFKNLELDIGKILYSTDNLVSTLDNDQTDTIIIDIDAKGQDAFECLESISTQRSFNIIIFAPEEKYEYAYKAMKLGAQEILIHPISPEQVFESLINISRKSIVKTTVQSSAAFSSREFFVEHIHLLDDNSKSIEEINATFHTTFNDGFFRVVTFAIDYYDSTQIPEISRQIRTVIRRFLTRNFWFGCYDIVYSIIYNEIRIVINYSQEVSATIPKNMSNLYFEVQKVCSSTAGLKVFMGVGLAYNSINRLPTSAEESMNSIWSRLGADSQDTRIVTYSTVSLSQEDQSNVFMLDAAVKAAIDILDKQAFEQSVNEFFSLPVQILSSSFTRRIMLDQVKYFRDLYKEKLDQIDNALTFYYSAKMTLLTSQTFEEYRRRYINIFLNMFDQLSAYNSDNDQDRYITRAKKIIEQRYSDNLTLDELSEEIKISSCYLSRLFKEKTGKSFSDYLTSQRLSAARTLLSETDYRIKEICYSVGYTDQRYFARVFSREFGITPTEFRNIHTKDN